MDYFLLIITILLICIFVILFLIRVLFLTEKFWKSIVDIAQIASAIVAVIMFILYLNKCEPPPPPNPTSTYETEIEATDTFTPTYTPIITSTFSPTKTLTPTPISKKVDISLPTDYEIKNLESIWLLVPEDTQIKIPGRKSYTANINSNEKRLWMFYWCATDPSVLEENLNYIKTTFLIDGNTVPTEKISEYDKFLSKNKWYCHYWSIKLHDWEPSSLIKLEIGIKFTRSIEDNISSYPAGLYSLILDILVE